MKNLHILDRQRIITDNEMSKLALTDSQVLYKQGQTVHRSKVIDK